MPRNNRQIDRAVRVDRVLDAAEVEFLARGYSATTMAGIARAAGATSPALYWYFSSKDSALVAVQRRVLEGARADFQHEPNAMSRLTRYLDVTRARARPLHRLLHERSGQSDEVAQLLDEIHVEIEGLILDAISERSDNFADAKMVASIGLAIIEGTNAVLSDEHSSALVRWAIERLVPVDPPAH
jgi:AcrR family transcriptional regulator